jgi:hypothetical protein
VQIQAGQFEILMTGSGHGWFLSNAAAKSASTAHTRLAAAPHTL